MIFFYIMEQFNKKIKIKMCQNIANILTRIAYFVVNFKRIKQWQVFSGFYYVKRILVHLLKWILR